MIRASWPIPDLLSVVMVGRALKGRYGLRLRRPVKMQRPAMDPRRVTGWRRTLLRVRSPAGGLPRAPGGDLRVAHARLRPDASLEQHRGRHAESVAMSEALDRDASRSMRRSRSAQHGRLLRVRAPRMLGRTAQGSPSKEASARAVRRRLCSHSRGGSRLSCSASLAQCAVTTVGARRDRRSARPPCGQR